MVAGLVGGEGFAIDASVVEAVARAKERQMTYSALFS
jgi:hypothetical protein